MYPAVCLYPCRRLPQGARHEGCVRPEVTVTAPPTTHRHAAFCSPPPLLPPGLACRRTCPAWWTPSGPSSTQRQAPSAPARARCPPRWHACRRPPPPAHMPCCSDTAQRRPCSGSRRSRACGSCSAVQMLPRAPVGRLACWNNGSQAHPVCLCGHVHALCLVLTSVRVHVLTSACVAAFHVTGVSVGV